MEKTAAEFIDKEILEIASQLGKGQKDSEEYRQAIRHLIDLINIREGMLHLNNNINS